MENAPYSFDDLSDEQRDNSGGSPVDLPKTLLKPAAPLQQYDTDMSDEQWSNS